MPALEVWGRRGYERVIRLTDVAYIVGSDPKSAQIVVDDPAVSQIHLVLERVGPAWLVRDLGSRNGTQVKGERLVSQRRLRHRDEIHAGHTRLIFFDHAEGQHPGTQPIEPPPDNITRGEMKVLIELCRPWLLHNRLQSPASRSEIAANLFVGVQAVQQHLSHLYDKFDIPAEPRSKRREMLANAALDRAAVSISDLAPSQDIDGRGA